MANHPKRSYVTNARLTCSPRNTSHSYIKSLTTQSRCSETYPDAIGGLSPLAPAWDLADSSRRAGATPRIPTKMPIQDSSDSWGEVKRRAREYFARSPPPRCWASDLVFEICTT